MLRGIFGRCVERLEGPYLRRVDGEQLGGEARGERLVAAGFTRVMNMTGGMLAYRSAALPAES